MHITIARATTLDKAGFLLEQGYCPIQCQSNGTSIVDELGLSYQVNPGRLVIQAYANFGARSENLSFVFMGNVTASLTFAVAALSGVLPHPSRAAKFDGKPPSQFLHKSDLTRDMTDLARLIDAWTRDPIGTRLRLRETEDGKRLLLYDEMSSGFDDAASAYAGFDRWRKLLTGRSPEHLLVATVRRENDRIDLAGKARFEWVSDLVGVVESSIWGFDVWHETYAPVLLAFGPNHNVSLSCADEATAERYFGKGGLMNVYPQLGPGWHGRKINGGSPRGVQLTRHEIFAAANTVAGLVRS